METSLLDMGPVVAFDSEFISPICAKMVLRTTLCGKIASWMVTTLLATSSSSYLPDDSLISSSSTFMSFALFLSTNVFCFLILLIAWSYSASLIRRLVVYPVIFLSLLFCAVKGLSLFPFSEVFLTLRDAEGDSSPWLVFVKPS